MPTVESLEREHCTSCEWMDTARAAQYLCLPIGTLRNWTSNGRIPFRKLGRRNRYNIHELRDFLNQHRRGPIYVD